MCLQFIKIKTVLEAPRLSKVSGPEKVRIDEMVEFTCDSIGHPLSNITWTFRPCEIKPKWPTCKSSPLIVQVSKSRCRAGENRKV